MVFSRWILLFNHLIILSSGWSNDHASSRLKNNVNNLKKSRSLSLSEKGYYKDDFSTLRLFRNNLPITTTTTTARCSSSSYQSNCDDGDGQCKDQLMKNRPLLLPELAIILPSYNEENRIVSTLNDYCQYFLSNDNSDSEKKQQQQQQKKIRDAPTDKKLLFSRVDIIVVNDGSSDETASVVEQFKHTAALERNTNVDTFLDVHVLNLTKNVGKGAAIASGIEYIHVNNHKQNHHDSDDDANYENDGIIILVADADGSGDITCLPDFIHELNRIILLYNSASKSYESSVGITSSGHSYYNYNDIAAMVVGNRREMIPKGLTRSITSWGFRTCVQILCGSNKIKDTQCGFKVMTLAAGKTLYDGLYLQRWTHDVEVLYRAQFIYDYPLSSCPVNWTDRPGSKLLTEIKTTNENRRKYYSTLQVIQISMTMLWEIILMRWIYATTDQRYK